MGVVFAPQRLFPTTLLSSVKSDTPAPTEIGILVLPNVAPITLFPVPAPTKTPVAALAKLPPRTCRFPAKEPHTETAEQVVSRQLPK